VTLALAWLQIQRAGLLLSLSTAIAWSSRSRDARTGLVANPESSLLLSLPTTGLSESKYPKNY
jgi:hypothetical protein